MRATRRIGDPGPAFTRGDEAAVVTWFEGLGPRTRHARFLAQVKRLDAGTLKDLADVDHRDHEALAAVSADGVTVGIGRYVRLPHSSDAELAVAVADAWRGRGIATLLLNRVASTARAAGIRRVLATCLVSNDQILRLVAQLGPTVVSPPDCGVVEVSVDLTGPPRVVPEATGGTTAPPVAAPSS